MSKMAVYRYESGQLFDIQKERYNAFQTGNGIVKSKADKARNRNSKLCKAQKNELKQYCY